MEITHIDKNMKDFTALQLEHAVLMDKSNKINRHIKTNNTGFIYGHCIYKRETVFKTIGNTNMEVVYYWPEFEWYLKTKNHLELCKKWGNYPKEYSDEYVERKKIADDMYCEEFKEYIKNIIEYSGSCRYYEDILSPESPVYSVGHGIHKRLVVPVEKYDKCDPDVNSENDIVIYSFSK